MQDGYTTPDGRHVYALLYELESEPPTSRELVVPLNSNGDCTSPKIAACEPNERVVTTRPGQFVMCCGKREKVVAVRVYR